MNNYEAVGLYEHNARSYAKVEEAFKIEDVVGIVHATGTGKSFNALQLAYDNKDKEIVYVVPSNGIIEHIEKIIEENPNLDRNRDFPNLHFRTYSSFVNLSEEEMEAIPCDLLVLDEFHHIGAPIWGSQINKMKETHPNMKVFGMTAYTIRDRGTVYERDMADPNGNELFSNKIVSRYDLCDAMIDGVLPKPIYKSAYVHLTETELSLEKMIEKMNHSLPEYNQCKELLDGVKRKIQEAPSIPELLKKSIKPDGKYIYFCPPVSQEGANDIETIKKQALEWFKQIGYKEEDIEFYTSTSEMGAEGKKNREAFYNDQTLDGKPANGKLRIMFAINQYNEGIHAPNIDGVIMGRGTESDIVFFEQLGRALAVRGNTKESYEALEKYSREELISMCLERDILIKVGTPKEEIIEKLLAPTIIDLANNIGFIKQLETNLQNRMKSIIESKNAKPEKREIKISDASFDITIENEDLFEVLSYVMDRLTNTWEANYELAKAYYEKYKHLQVPKNFKTKNGYEYDENGVALGAWIQNQRQVYKKQNRGKISSEQIQKLESIGMIWDVFSTQWETTYELAKIYYEKNNNLQIPWNFKTKNGYEYDENGVALGAWIIAQRISYKGKNLELNQIQKLELIGMVWDAQKLKNETRWETNYELAKAYYEKHKNLQISRNFKTINGYDEVTEGMEGYEEAVNLGRWIETQRQVFRGTRSGKISQEQIQKLEAIGIVWESLENQWEANYELAKAYYEKYKHLQIPWDFKTTNGYEHDENGVKLGVWISRQRQNCKRKILTLNQIQKLESIGMIWDVMENQWETTYQLAKAYYEKYKHLQIPWNFKTTNGYDYDESGVKLGEWISEKRKAYKGNGTNKLTSEQIQKLESIGMIWDVMENQWEMNYQLVQVYSALYGHLPIATTRVNEKGIELKKGDNGYDTAYQIGVWIDAQKKAYKGTRGKITQDKIQRLEVIGIVWDTKKNKEQISDFCDSKEINPNKNKSVLKRISARELQIKTSFLDDMNVKLVDSNGKLHPIFSMSNPNMKAEYGVTMEELYAKYYLEEKEVQK